MDQTAPKTQAFPIELPVQGAPRPRRLSIKALMIAVVIASIAPAVGLLIFAVDKKADELEQARVATGTQLAQNVAGALENEFAAQQTILAVFSSSGWLEAGELDLLYFRARHALNGSNRHLIVLDEDLNQLLNTRSPFGAPLGKTSDIETAAKVLATGQPAVSDVFYGAVAQAAVFDVLRRTMLPDGGKRLLILTRDAEMLEAAVRPKQPVPLWAYAVLDGEGKTVFASGGDVAVGLPADCERDPGASQDGRAAIVRNVQGSGWTVCAWPSHLPGVAVFDRLWDTPLLGVALWAVVTTFVAVFVGGSVSRAVAQTARFAQQLGRGSELPAAPSYISEVDAVRQALAHAAVLRAEKDERLRIALSEMAHRAKNQIAVFASLVGLAERHADSAAELKQDLTERLAALARLVDVLTGSGVGLATAADLRSVVMAQLDPFVKHAEDRLEVEGEELLLNEQAAQAVCLVLHELATNATKYGAWSHPAGNVCVRWRREERFLVLSWTEAGMPARPPEHEGFGTQLMKALVEGQLNGRIRREYGSEGFRCELKLDRETIRPPFAAGG